MNNHYQPYTYLIGWSQHRKFYYGVRYARNCTPADLWVKYYTSSREVAAMKTLYGDPDLIQVRKVFSSKERARLWENKVLRRLKVVAREDFLNKNDAPAPPINNRVMAESTKSKISAIHKGKPKSEEHKQKIREARAKQVNTRRGVPASEETKQKIREARMNQTATEETKQKMSAARKGANHWSYGKPRPEETKKRISESLKSKSLKGKNQ